MLCVKAYADCATISVCNHLGWMSVMLYSCHNSLVRSSVCRSLMPNAHRRRDETVLSRRRCVHEIATSWRQFRRVVGVNTPIGSRDPVYNFLC